MSIDFVELNRGPVVVIDDEIGEEEKIDKIILKIKEKGFPVLKYKTLDEADKEIGNICFSNFIILDWLLYPEETPTGVSIGDELKESLNEKKVEFIKKIKSVCFSPIFIFTSISEEGIEEEIGKMLKGNGLLYSDYRKNFIFIRNKQEILKNLFEDINKWVLKNPHIYLSKIWLTQFLKNSNGIFWSLYEKNSNWPNIFYKSFVEDGEDPINGLNNILFRLVNAKMDHNDFDTDIIKKQVDEPNINEIKSLYGEIMYLKENIMDDIKPGDIFKDGEEYYINIRPECDTTKRDNNGIDNTDVYLIKGVKIDDGELKKHHYSKKTGIVNKVVSHILPFLDGNNFVSFEFENLEIKQYSKIKSKKKYRLLPPFITRFQHRFSSFSGRYGVPKVPKVVFNEIFKKPKEEE